jgi:C4-dicarboxylate-specific signal transduction histidine kinase
MQWIAGTALSRSVVRVDSQARPCDVRETIAQTRATHAAVFQGEECRGVVSAAEVLKYAPRRPFGAMLPPRAPATFTCDMPLDEAVRRLAGSEVDAAVVFDEGGSFAGVVTHQSLLTALLARNEELAERETKLRTVLDELAQSGRISTMGEMASGLAHELNQPLAAIVAYVDACQELVESGRMDGQQLSTVLRSVSSQAERAGQIIHRMRKMIRRTQPVRTGMNVNDAVREVVELLEAEARQAGAAIDLDLADDLPQIEADFLQIQHVVLNLVRNGVEAMKRVPADQRRLVIATGRTAAGEVEIAVHDLGDGLGGARPDQLFEPFFTTKPGGTGLGLSISRTIVEAHGGRISMTANSPRGATARFTLPPGSGKAVHDETTDRVHR